ncbi:MULTISPECIES: flagellar basal body P-ring protein FlgI [Pseudoalteromonas]|uniref:Flagellar P-ring protein n=1 Tax=Pseudoalteromonas luteoviolacea (strain 2ta16) TaxID=1353533 RepID=V4J4W0_PSEL2|nr:MULTISPECIES: flagellar basal body P-ring protein FlgI [Pseudoalteromonas]ESP90387.1 Flagellar basal-body P-ring protein [Pseudoalteromonas luteoviolacea 2ta16]KZN42044.1 flagellar P-ring protein FlgI [Pseudoalteromonas luteoviolacea NCIMB 1944]MCG7549904.1 flagellar basal body P-ring protein FlgI [Pseudoalteromonas sp. Of7M-16]
MRIVQTLVVLFTLILSLEAAAERIKDVSVVEGVRSNQLIGYGLVVGLPGTGEQSRFTEQSFKAMLNSFGITLPGNLKPKIKNVAAVAVHADLPPFVKPGQSIDVTVSSIGSAGSLRGGTLLQTFLKGVDGNVYAIAQGSMIVGGLGAEGLDGSRVVINTPTVGRIPNGGMVERAVKSPFTQGDHITFNLNRPDFTTAKRLADTINELVGPNSASALDAASVRVIAPRDPSQRVAYLSTLENLEFKPADTSAKIIVNSRTGTIVIGKDVKLQPAAITHGGLTVTIAEQTNVSQPQPLTDADAVVTRQSIVDVDQDDSRAFVFDPGSSLDDLVRAINAVGAAPGDLMAILEALKEAGAIHGQLVVI